MLNFLRLSGGSKTIAESYVADLERLNELDALMAEGFIYREDQYDELASLKYQQALRTAIKKTGIDRSELPEI